MSQTTTSTKRTYTKPTLTEYGSLTEQTKVFGLLNPDVSNPDIVTSVIQSVTSLTL